MHTHLRRIVSTVVVCLALAAPAAGQVLINQAKAKAGLGGCDLPGFPVTLCKSGPYKLTGSLSPTAPNQTMIEVAANVVTIDLNSYFVGGNCSLGSTSGTGIATVGGRTQVAVLNGVVSCMGGMGIWLDGDNHRVERVTAVLNGYDGIRVGSASIVRDNQANSNGAAGIVALSGTIISGNTGRFNVNGIVAAEGCAVTSNTVTANHQYGLSGYEFGYAFNVMYGNGLGPVYPTANAVRMGGNTCGVSPC